MDIGPIEKVGDRPVPIKLPTFNPSRRDDAPLPQEPPQQPAIPAEKEKENV